MINSDGSKTITELNAAGQATAVEQTNGSETDISIIDPDTDTVLGTALYDSNGNLLADSSDDDEGEEDGSGDFGFAGSQQVISATLEHFLRNSLQLPNASLYADFTCRVQASTNKSKML